MPSRVERAQPQPRRPPVRETRAPPEPRRRVWLVGVAPAPAADVAGLGPPPVPLPVGPVGPVDWVDPVNC